MYSSTHSATYISIYSSIYSSGKVLELCMSKIPQPPGMVACRRPLSLSLSLSFSVVLSSHLWFSLSLSLSPSVIVSSHLWLSLSVSVSVPHSSRSACGWFCQARAAQQAVQRAAQQAVKRCARTAGCAALLSHATMAQGPSQTDLAQRALLGASPLWSCQRGAGRTAPDSRGPPPP